MHKVSAGALDGSAASTSGVKSSSSSQSKKKLRGKGSSKKMDEIV
jgi:hypothetical protein